MHAIFASKLYRASKHKDKIRAALNNPLNTELVIQLNEYLDDSDLEQLKEAKLDSEKPSDASEDATDEESVDVAEDSGSEGHESIRPSKVSTPHSAPPADHHLSESLADTESESRQDTDSEEKRTFDVQSSKPESESSEVSEATQATQSSVIASYTPLDVDDISGALNSRADTTGVCRILRKDSELWIHYNDAINLNNVMEPAISALNASNYSYLDFNRLARTENAIVFTISETPKAVASVQEMSNE